MSCSAPRKLWSESEIEQVRSMFEKNVPIKEIALLLERSTSAVSNIAYVHGFSRKRGFQVMELNPKWRGGKRISNYGYVEIYKPNHHRARTTGYVFEHILVAEEKLGRKLQTGEVVHHINEVKTDNRPENLVVMSNEEHTRMHSTGKKGKNIPCPVCGTEFYAKPVEIINRTRVTCSRSCANKYRFMEGNPNAKQVPLRR